MLKYAETSPAGIAALAEAGRQMLAKLGDKMEAGDRQYAIDLHAHAVHKLANGALGAAYLWTVALAPEVIGSACVAEVMAA